MWKKIAAIAAALVLVATPSLAEGAVKDPFIRTFPKLPGFIDPSQQQIADLAQTMLDPNNDSENNEAVTSGFTYFGQFLDHDMTLDTSPPPKDFVDPTTLTNSRTFALDLDSVYGGGPTVNPELYEADKKHFKVQKANLNGVRDLPRRADGSAILVEKRNDENQVLSQIHVTFLMAHNRLIDSGMSFVNARATLRKAYQQAVYNDFLPEILSPVNPTKVKQLEPKKKGTPVEFAVSAYRFGHTQVRLAYRLNGNNNCQNLQVFSLTAPDASLMGGRPLQAGRQIDFGMFFTDFPQPEGCAGVQPRNLSREIDPLISASLFRLPIPGAEASGSNVLAFRNMSRAHFYKLPSGQAVAKQMGLPVITPQTLDLGPGFEKGTPLWFYVLEESERTQDGRKLGPVGSHVVKAGFDSARTNAVKAETGTATVGVSLTGNDKVMTFADLIRFAGTVK